MTDNGARAKTRSLILRAAYNASIRLLVKGYRAYSRLRNGSRTIGAAAIISNSKSEIVLVKLAYRSGWGLPGGFSTRREPPTETVRREVHEETGIILGSLPDSPTVLLDTFNPHVSFIYVTESESEPKRPVRWRLRLEVRAVGRFPINSLPPLYVGTEAMLRAAGVGPNSD